MIAKLVDLILQPTMASTMKAHSQGTLSKCRIPEVAAKLQLDADRPDLPELQRCLLADDLVLVPGHPAVTAVGRHGKLPA